MKIIVLLIEIAFLSISTIYFTQKSKLRFNIILNELLW